MVSPAILLFMALAHLCIDWGGLIYHIGGVRYFGCNNRKLIVEHVDFSGEKVVLLKKGVENVHSRKLLHLNALLINLRTLLVDYGS